MEFIFKTKRELKWYIKGLSDAKKIYGEQIDMEIKRYADGMKYHMDFDNNGNVLDSSVQPSTVTDLKKFNENLTLETNNEE